VNDFFHYDYWLPLLRASANSALLERSRHPGSKPKPKSRRDRAAERKRERLARKKGRK
jgi:hypothetical protein